MKIFASFVVASLFLGAAAARAQSADFQLPPQLNVEGVAVELEIDRQDLEAREGTQHALPAAGKTCLLDQLKTIRAFLQTPANKDAFVAEGLPAIKVKMTYGKFESAALKVGNDFYASYFFETPDAYHRPAELSFSFTEAEGCQAINVDTFDIKVTAARELRLVGEKEYRDELASRVPASN